MNLNYDFSPVIVQAHKLVHKDRLEDALSLLLTELEKYPIARGAADALHLVGIIHMNNMDQHRTEAACLLSYRLRATLIDPNLAFDSLVNLVRACINLKSFNEGYYYGTIAEKMGGKEDPDLLANMVACCVFSDRHDQALERRDRLQALSPQHAAYINAFIQGTSDFQPTHHLSCTQLADEFENLRHADSRQGFNSFKNLLTQLQDRPDGIDAWRCWRIVCEIHNAMIPKDQKKEFLQLQQAACMAAAAGKAIAFHPTHADNDALLWAWRGQALGQMCLYEQGLEALLKAQEIDPAFQGIEQNIAYTRRMLSLPPDSAQRPDSKAWLEERLVHLDRSIRTSEETELHRRLSVEAEAANGRFRTVILTDGPPIPGLGARMFLLTLMPASFGGLTLEDQQQLRAMLQRVVDQRPSPGKLTVIPVWEEDEESASYLAPRNWIGFFGEYFKTHTLQDLLSQSRDSIDCPECAAHLKSKTSGCFIATAATGGASSWQVQTLQEFRDVILSKFEAGRRFIQWYYRKSPPAAANLESIPALRRIVWTLVSVAAVIVRAIIWPFRKRR